MNKSIVNLRIIYTVAALWVLSAVNYGQTAGSFPYSESDGVKLSQQQLLKYSGGYLPTGTDTRMIPMAVILYKDVLYRHVNNDYVALNPVSDHKFIYDDNSGRTLDFVSDKNGKVTEVIITRPDGEFRMKRDQSAAPEIMNTREATVNERIEELLNKYSEYRQFNGTVLVSQNGKVIFRKAYGMANMELGVPNQTDTRFRLASVSKQFTAMLIMQLVEKGKLDLHTPITAYLPDYPAEQGQKITLHHLLTHSSGIPNFTSFPDYHSRIMRNHHTPEELVKLFSALPLEFEPGKRFNYSNSGYVLLGYIIEKVSGKTYEQCLKDQIFTPLKMKNSGYDNGTTVLANRAIGYDKAGNSYRNASFIDMSVPYAAGGLYSTVDDLYLWDQSFYTDLLISQKSKGLMFKNYFENAPGDYGYGWSIHNINSQREKKSLILTEHSGGINGFNTFISRMPADGNMVVLLNNATGNPLYEISYAIRAILYDKPYDMPRQSLAYTLADVINAEGLAAGLTRFRELKKSNSYKLDEGEMNGVGYDFLNDNKIPEAIEIFKLNVEAFPNGWNCYDSLGEAYLKQGDKKLATLNYKKSVELNPQNEAGKKALAELSK